MEAAARGIGERRRTAVVDAFPMLAGEQFVDLGAGQFAEAFVAGDVVVRFARSEFGRQKLRSDADLLRVISADLPLPTSTPIHDALDGPLEAAFIAHRYLPGSVLRPTVVASLDPSARDALAGRLGSFLEALHAIDVERLPASIPRVNAAAYAEALRHRVGSELFDRMRPAGRERAQRELDGLGRAFADETEALCHTDIGGNVIYDASTGRTGVIDFGEAVVGHPVLDVASLSVLGEEFVIAASKTYPLLARSLEAAAAVRATFVLQDALGGASQDDWAYVDDVLSGYE